MQSLNFPVFDFRFKNSENKVHIFDPIRKKFVVLQPEEWVRQNVLQFLIQTKKYPKSHINVEKQLKVNTQNKRYDIVIFDSSGNITLLVECKSPKIAISQESFDQIAKYNMELKAEFLMVTNGIQHFYCKMDFSEEKYTFLEQIPDFSR